MATVNVNVLVSVAVPTLIVAVKVTTTSFSPLVTTPATLIAALLLAQVITAPCIPLVGKITFLVTLFAVSPLAKLISSAFLASNAFSASVNAVSSAHLA